MQWTACQSLITIIFLCGSSSHLSGHIFCSLGSSVTKFPAAGTSSTQVQSTARASTPEPADIDLFAEEEAVDVVIGSSRDDGKMYAGSGKWIDKAAWGTLFRALGDSMVCRMASTIYWTPDELRNRSVTGTLSNKSRSTGRTEARQAVTPEKLSSLKSLLRIFMGSDVTPEDEKKRMKSMSVRRATWT
ncbi:uncharacterized protein [Dermacentor albipictus]|uniref:uncharacterized protein isoform X2 n=1 Tax=Dermacentor albipictus TaxID=60249 RepID=UPI0038FCAE3D